jgi:hypothetical protein
MVEKYSTKETRLGRNVFKVERIKKPDDENLLKPGEEEGEGYKGTPDMYPDYEEDRKELIGDIEGSMPTITPETRFCNRRCSRFYALYGIRRSCKVSR